VRGGDCRRNQQELARLIMRQFEEFRSLKATHQPVHRVQFRPKWSRPPVGFIKERAREFGLYKGVFGLG
jgi:hypothetical protein